MLCRCTALKPSYMTLFPDNCGRDQMCGHTAWIARRNAKVPNKHTRSAFTPAEALLACACRNPKDAALTLYASMRTRTRSSPHTHSCVEYRTCRYRKQLCPLLHTIPQPQTVLMLPETVLML